MNGLEITTNPNQTIRLWIGIKMTCNEIGHSFVIDMNFINSGSCRRCGKIKTYAGEWV